MMSVTGKDVGSSLREARERRGLTLRQVASATRISVQALEALERNDIARLPGGIFSRAFVRAYAEQVGLDAEETVRDFVEQFPVDAVTYGSPLVEARADAERDVDADLKPWPNLLLIGATAAAAIFGLTLAVLWARGGLAASAAADPSLAPPSPNQTAPTAESSPAVIAPNRPAEAPSAARVDGLRVSIVSDTPCWARIVADGTVTHEGLLQPGRSEVRDARGLLLVTLGDAMACRVTLNGRPVRALGDAGEVVTLRVTPETLDRYVTR